MTVKIISCPDCGLLLRVARDRAVSNSVYDYDINDWQRRCKRLDLGPVWCLNRCYGTSPAESLTDSQCCVADSASTIANKISRVSWDIPINTLWRAIADRGGGGLRRRSRGLSASLSLAVASEHRLELGPEEGAREMWRVSASFGVVRLWREGEGEPLGMAALRGAPRCRPWGDGHGALGSDATMDGADRAGYQGKPPKLAPIGHFRYFSLVSAFEFIPPCSPVPAKAVPVGDGWLH